MSRHLPFVVFLFLLPLTPAHALEHCTRALLGAGPALGPVVCTEVQSDRGTIIAVRQAQDIRAARTEASQAPTEPPMVPPVGSIITMDPTGFSRRGTEAGDPRRFCGDNTACQQWYIDYTYIAQDGAVRLKTPYRSHRYWDRRGTVTGPKRGGVFVKVR